MSKKTFYIILIVVIILMAIGGLVWYFVLKPKEIITPTAGVDFTVPGRVKNGPNLSVLSKGPALSANLDDYGILWYYDYSGKLWQFSGDGVIEYNDNGDPIVMDQPPIGNLSEIIWPKTVSPDGKKIVYQKNSGLFTSDPGGKNQKTLVSDLKLKDLILKWPTANNIALISKPSGLSAGGLWFLDVRNLGINKVIDDFGLEVLFSLDGNSFIYSYTDQNGKKLRLAFYDENKNTKIINNVSTLVDKCAWVKNQINIYCAVPKSWPEFAILPDDYYKNTFSTNDDIWKINTETGEKTLIFEYIGDISNLAVSNDESRIFFISKENQYLYKLNLR